MRGPGVLGVAVLLLLGACSSRAPAGETFTYRRGSAEVDLAAGAERDSFDVSLLREATYTVNRTLRFVLVGNRGELEVRVAGVGEEARSFAGDAVFVRLVHAGREVNNRPEGGVCSVTLSELSGTRAEGLLQCAGLGTHSGKGYDASARFELGPEG